MNFSVLSALSTDDTRNVALPALRKVFTSMDVLKSPYNIAIRERIILYDYRYELTSPLKEIIFNTAQEVGNEGFFLSVLTSPELEDPSQNNHWYIPFSAQDQYPDILWGPLGNVIYSPTGNWAIMLDYEVTLMGGIPEFINIVRHKFSSLDSQVIDFLLFWKEEKEIGHPVHWIKPLLEDVYGVEKASLLLEQTSF